MTFLPATIGMFAAVQFVVPVAAPLLPRMFAHVTQVKRAPLDAVPVSVRCEPAVVLCVSLMVGGAVAGGGVAGGGVAGGGVVADCVAPVPTTAVDTRSPSEVVNVTFPLAVAATVGVKRSVTAWVAPTASVNGLPDTTRKGPEGAETAPDTVSLLEFFRVNVRSANLPTPTAPKFTVPVGLTEKSP